MGHNSQTSLTLGRRPRAVTSSRGPQAFTMTTVWTTRIRAAPTTTWSAPLSVSAKRDMSMINQQIRARRAAVLINIPAPAQVKVLQGIHVAENMCLAIAPTGIIGVVQNAQRILVAAIHGVTLVSQMQ